VVHALIIVFSEENKTLIELPPRAFTLPAMLCEMGPKLAPDPTRLAPDVWVRLCEAPPKRAASWTEPLSKDLMSPHAESETETEGIALKKLIRTPPIT
jgi:hypothetical protein